MLIISWPCILVKSILVEVILRKIFFNQGRKDITFHIILPSRYVTIRSSLYKYPFPSFTQNSEETVILFRRIFQIWHFYELVHRTSFLKKIHRMNTRICESPCICIHTTNRFHVIGINYARTLCCHAGSAALDVDRGSIRPDRAIRRRDREPR